MMKTITKSAVFAFICLLLTIKLVYAQHTIEEYFSKGIDYAIQGKFEKARVEFNNALKLDPLNTGLEISLRIVKDVLDQKIEV